jgi:hypothetical protein
MTALVFLEELVYYWLVRGVYYYEVKERLAVIGFCFLLKDMRRGAQ